MKLFLIILLIYIFIGGGVQYLLEYKLPTDVRHVADRKMFLIRYAAAVILWPPILYRWLTDEEV